MLGHIFAVLSLALALVLYVKGKKKSRLKYQTSNLKIIGNLSLKLPTDFEVTLSGEKIDSLHKTQLIIWNGGTTTLHGRDIVEDEPLKAVFNESTKIFNLAVAGKSRTANKFKAIINEEHKNEVIFSFDYLNRNDGVLLEILHTESVGNLKVIGELKGLTEGIKDKGVIDYIKPPHNMRWLRIFLISFVAPLLVSLVLSFVVLILYIIISVSEDSLTFPGIYFSVTAGLFLSFFGITNLSFWSKKKYPRSIKLRDDIP